MSKMDDDQVAAAPAALAAPAASADEQRADEQRAAEIAEWLRYQPYVPASVRETLLAEIARLRGAGF